ncbi:MAG: hypothetical protein A2Z38_01945 [Planctomycetes bacterium RBG_19FT_COMBO_48_8]|nr:MAG: hypothetical protein A2Z38_01945 [Planctomycetes bacterium RBG_19FT_COMBO_48_8]
MVYSERHDSNMQAYGSGPNAPAKLSCAPHYIKKALEQTRAGAETFFLKRYYIAIITFFHDFVKMKKG